MFGALTAMPYILIVTMKKSLLVVQSQSSESDSDGTDQAHNQSIVVPTTVIAIADSFQKKDNSWYNLTQP